MEQTGVMSEETWSSLSCMYTSKEESEFLTELLSGFSCPNEMTYDLNLNGTRSGIWPSDQETSSFVCSSEFCNSTECLVSQETSTFSPDDGQSVLYLGGTFDDVSGSTKRPSRMSWTGDSVDNVMELHSGYLMPIGDYIMFSDSFRGSSDQYDLSDIGKLEKREVDLDRPWKSDLPNALESMKRSWNVTDVSRSKKTLKSDKYQKVVADNVTKNDEVITKKNCVSHSREEHSNITQEVTRGETLTSKTSKASGVKGKSGKSASSDPQSVYARKRRERVNERLRILQGLVPNGTKVDISTMLEEAVLYVKFLQLQIKLLSSDDTWMYAPLAYNGMDIGISNIDITTTFTR